MPVVHVYMLEGRPPERIRDLMARVTRAVCESLDVSPDRVRVVVSEVPGTHWAVGGVPMAPQPSPSKPPQGTP